MPRDHAILKDDGYLESINRARYIALLENVVYCLVKFLYKEGITSDNYSGNVGFGTNSLQ